MGAHITTENRKKGTRFTTWAPNASKITVVGDFSEWKEKEEFEMKRITKAGIWSVFIPGFKSGEAYKYSVTSKEGSKIILKSDPYATNSELRPNTASLVEEDKKFRWADKKWLDNREKTNIYKEPVNIYEVHLQSWKMKGDEDFYNFREIAPIIAELCKRNGIYSYRTYAYNGASI